MSRFAPDVMLLAAGLGLRMRPLTEVTPKPLISVAGTPLLDRALNLAAAEGCRHFVVNAHYHANEIRAHLATLAERRSDLRFELSEEPTLLDTGGGVKRALPLLDTDPLLVMNTDAFWPEGSDQPLARMGARFDLGDADLVLLCVQPGRALGFRRSHDFCLDPRGVLTRDFGQPIIYAGVALLRRRLLEAVELEKFSLYELFVDAMDGGRLAGVVLDAPWLHVGDPQALTEAEAMLSAGVA